MDSSSGCAMQQLHASQHNNPHQDEAPKNGKNELLVNNAQHNHFQEAEPQRKGSQDQPGATPITNTESGGETLPEECLACLCVYEEPDRRPHLLPCGHTFCLPCITSILKEGHLPCPTCLVDHHTTDASHFPVNYALENMIYRFQALQAKRAPLATAEATPGMSQQNGEAGFGRKLKSVIKEQRQSMESLEATLKQELKHLEQYRFRLSLSLAKHGHQLVELDKVGQQHRKAMKLLMEEDLRVESFIEEGEKDMRDLKAAQDQLYFVTSAHNAYPIIDSADASTAVVEEWLQHSEEEFPNGTAYSTSRKLVETTEAALLLALENEDTTESVASGHQSCTVSEMLKKICKASSEHVRLHVKDLLMKAMEGDPVSDNNTGKNNCISFPMMTTAGDTTPSPSTFTFRLSCFDSGVPFPAPKFEAPPPSKSSSSQHSSSQNLNRRIKKAHRCTMKRVTHPSPSPAITTTPSTPTTTDTDTTASPVIKKVSRLLSDENSES